MLSTIVLVLMQVRITGALDPASMRLRFKTYRGVWSLSLEPEPGNRIGQRLTAIPGGGMRLSAWRVWDEILEERAGGT